MQDQIDAVHEWLLSKINMAAVIKGVYRHDVYEFPEGALRELVTNAVMHRNYAVYGSDIQVALYDDRLEIISPGGLPRGMTIPRMMSGCSRCRNKAIAEAFAYMHVAEKWGLGIPNVMQEFVGHGLAAPEYTDWGNAVKVTVRRIPKKLDAGLEKPDIGDGIDTVNGPVDGPVKGPVNGPVNGPERLFVIIKLNPGLRKTALAELSGLSARTVKRYVETVLAKRIEFRGAPKTGGYYCKEA